MVQLESVNSFNYFNTNKSLKKLKKKDLSFYKSKSKTTMFELSPINDIEEDKELEEASHDDDIIRRTTRRSHTLREYDRDSEMTVRLSEDNEIRYEQIIEEDSSKYAHSVQKDF